MPIYGFECEECAESFDVRASIREKEAGLLPECPSCHSKRTRQLISAGLWLRSSGGSSLPSSGCGPNAMPGCCGQ
jgi:putative FmdB family regulatory protein